jgi:uncharacterized membrane protein
MISPRNFNRSDWLAIGLLALYVVVFTLLNVRQHDSFHSRALDLAKFDQSIWNTAHGRPYQITIGENAVIESHFSPALALFAPLYWIWPDIRVLFAAQSLLLGGAGFLIYWHFRRSAPLLGIIVFAAYLMHPALHQVNLQEFRRITLAVFAVSYALYHLLRQQYGWMALGLALALLSKEETSLVVLAFGLYIILVQKSYWVGIVTTVAGLAWFLLVPFVVLPRLMTVDQVAGYQHASQSFAYLGTTLPEVLATLSERPLIMFEYIGQPPRLRALLAFLWPSAFLFVLAPQLVLLMLPYLVLLLASTSDTMGTLGNWYPSVLTVLLFWAVGLGAARLAGVWRRAALGLLLLASFTAWFLTSELWPGRRFDAALFEVSDHHRAIAASLSGVPEEAIVMAQDPLVPHLSHRQEIYLLPWVRGGNRPDYVIFDRALATYPVDLGAYRTLFYDYLAGTEYKLAEQIASYYLFEYAGQVQPSLESGAEWENGLRLNGITTAVAPPGAPFATAHEGPLPASTTLRAALFWEVLDETETNQSVFVHVVDAAGRLVGQSDGWPADSHRPTSVLPAGERVRDVHYVELLQSVDLDELTIRIGLYESASGAPVQTTTGQPFIELPAAPALNAVAAAPADVTGYLD